MSSASLTASNSPAQRAEPEVARKTWLAVLGACLGAFLAILNIQVVSSALADLQGAIGAGVDEGGWIVTAYLVAEIIVIPLSGWFARAFSLRTYLLASTFFFLVFTVGCTFATNLGQMIVLRALQGFAGGSLIPLAFTLIMTRLPPSKHPIGLTIYSVSAIFAPSIGPVIGGYCNDNFGWQSIFLINLLPGAVMFGMLWLSLDREPRRLELLRQGDWVGIATMAIGLGCLETVLEEGNKDDWLGSPLITRLTVIAAVALVAFCIQQLVYARPLLHLRLFARRNFALGSIANFFFGFSLVWLAVHRAVLPGAGARLQRPGDRLGSDLDRPAATGVAAAHAASGEIRGPPVPGDRRLCALYSGQPPGRSSVGGLLRTAIHFLEPGARGGAVGGDDAHDGTCDRGHRARARPLGIGPVQHGPQPGRRHRYRRPADLSHPA